MPINLCSPWRLHKLLILLLGGTGWTSQSPGSASGHPAGGCDAGKSGRPSSGMIGRYTRRHDREYYNGADFDDNAGALQAQMTPDHGLLRLCWWVEKRIMRLRRTESTAG